MNDDAYNSQRGFEEDTSGAPAPEAQGTAEQTSRPKEQGADTPSVGAAPSEQSAARAQWSYGTASEYFANKTAPSAPPASPISPAPPVPSAPSVSPAPSVPPAPSVSPISSALSAPSVPPAPSVSPAPSAKASGWPAAPGSAAPAPGARPFSQGVPPFAGSASAQAFSQGSQRSAPSFSQGPPRPAQPSAPAPGAAQAQPFSQSPPPATPFAAPAPPAAQELPGAAPSATSSYQPAGAYAGGQSQYSRPTYVPDAKSGSYKPAKGKISMVTIGICLILSLLGGYIGPYLRELLPYPWEGGAAAVPIIVENLADNPWEDVADSVIESSVSIYIGSRGGGVDSIDAGSGVVISSDGYILTNAHVVENAGRAYKTEIYLYGEDYRYETNGPLELAAIDEELDLAVIKLPSGSFTPARLGDSDSVQLGDDVMAVGNSLGVYLDTVSRGAISHLSRDIQYDSGVVIKNEFQTDAAISPGNSGGGLYNNRGELIGLINANTTYDNMAQNLNFAIRINTAIEFIRSELGEGIISNESTLDMRLTDFIKESGYSAEEEAYSDGDGVYITDIEQYGAAYYARLIEGDKIVSIDGREVLQVADVQSYIKGCDIGKEVTVVISRMGLLYEYRIKTMRAW